jgi:hypothetical protein
MGAIDGNSLYYHLGCNIHNGGAEDLKELSSESGLLEMMIFDR